MTELLLALVFAVSLGVSTFSSNAGYEGQPGNQSSGQHGNNGGGGNTGYEGQPGNQSSGR